MFECLYGFVSEILLQSFLMDAQLSAVCQQLGDILLFSLQCCAAYSTYYFIAPRYSAEDFELETVSPLPFPPFCFP